MTNTTTTTRASWLRAVTLAVVAAAIAVAVTLGFTSEPVDAGVAFPPGAYAKLPEATSVAVHGRFVRCPHSQSRGGVVCRVDGRSVTLRTSLTHGLILTAGRQAVR